MTSSLSDLPRLRARFFYWGLRARFFYRGLRARLFYRGLRARFFGRSHPLINFAPSTAFVIDAPGVLA